MSKTKRRGGIFLYSWTTELEGYWLEDYKSEMQVQGKAGVYCVYACEAVAKDKIVVIRDLIHVGISDDIAKSIFDEENLSEWKTHLQEGESLCYAFSDHKQILGMRNAQIRYIFAGCALQIGIKYSGEIYV